METANKEKTPSQDGGECNNTINWPLLGKGLDSKFLIFFIFLSVIPNDTYLNSKARMRED